MQRRPPQPISCLRLRLPLLIFLWSVLGVTAGMPATARAVDDPGAAPVPTIQDPEDAILLSRSVTTSWERAEPREALIALNGALAPGPQLACDVSAPEMRIGVSDFQGRGVPVVRVLDALTPPGCVWSVHHRRLTLIVRLPPEAPTSGAAAVRHQPAPVIPDFRTRAVLRMHLRAWARAATADAVRDLLGPEDAQSPRPRTWPPLAALANEQRLIEALTPTLAIQLAGTDPLASGAAAIAAAFGIPALAPVVRARLVALGPPPTEIKGVCPPIDAAREELRALLVEALGGARDEASVPLLASLAVSPVPGAGSSLDLGDLGVLVAEREAANDALAAIGNPAARIALRQVLHDPQPWVLSWAAATALARIGDTESVTLVEQAFLRECARASAPQRRPGADNILITFARALGQLRGPSGVQEVLARIHVQPSLEWSLLQGLAGVRDPAIAPALVACMIQDPSLVESCIDAHLIRVMMAQEGVDHACIAQLRQLPHEGKTWAVIAETLGVTGTPTAIATMASLLHDHPPGPVRMVLAHALSNSLQPAAGEVLLDLITHDPDPQVRGAAVEGILGPLHLAGDEDGPFIADALAVVAHTLCTDPDPTVRLAAVYFPRSEWPDKAATLRLWARQLLLDPDPMVQQRLVLHLFRGVRTAGMLGDPKVRSQVLAALALAQPAAQAANDLQSLLELIPTAESRALATAVAHAPDHGIAGLALVAGAVEAVQPPAYP